MSNYISLSEKDKKEMLSEIGVKNSDELFKDIPSGIKAKPLNLPDGLSQQEVFDFMESVANENKVFDTVLRGAGAYSHYIPSPVRAIVSRSEFVTAYTPYQAEMSQGILRSIFEYQTFMCRLTGMEVSNASHYSGATAAAEAALMFLGRKTKVLTFDNVNPDTLAVMKTYIEARGFSLEVLKSKDGLSDVRELENAMDDNVACVYFTQPNYFGLIEDVDSIASLCKAKGVKSIGGYNPTALSVLKTPAESGVDVATGEAQPLGLSLSFGGPYLGFITCMRSDMRKLTGRIVGETVDRDGNVCYVLTLQAREQHIRRERASSNICSNQAHCALTAAVYLATLGKKGFTEVGEACLSNAHYLAEQLDNVGLKRKYKGEFFHEFVTECYGKAREIEKSLAKEGILSGLCLSDDEMLWCATETADVKALDRAVKLAGEAIK